MKSLLERIQNLDRAFCWGFIGFLFALIGVYTTFFYERRPSIRYTVLANTPVFDIREDIPRLDVSFDGISVTQSKDMLSVVAVKVSNDGLKGIGKGDFDEAEPLGLIIDGGRVIGPQLIETSDPYIRKNLAINSSSNRVVFTPIIFDSGEFFTIKLLVLHPKSTKPSLVAVGKVMGVGNIKTDSGIETPGVSNTIQRSIEGPLRVQIVRVVAYPVFGVVCLLAFVGFAAIVSDWFSKRRNRKIAEEFRKLNAVKGQHLELLVEWLNDLGPSGLLSAERVLADDKRLQAAVARTKEYPLEADVIVQARNRKSDTDPMIVKQHWQIPHRIVAAGILHESTGRCSADGEFLKSLCTFNEFLKKQGVEFASDESQGGADIELASNTKG